MDTHKGGRTICNIIKPAGMSQDGQADRQTIKDTSIPYPPPTPGSIFCASFDSLQSCSWESTQLSRNIQQRQQSLLIRLHTQMMMMMILIDC
jgi:hypothetical protein